MIEERISKQELMNIYGVDRATIETWVKDRRLPLIKISSHKKYIRKTDLINWENERKHNENK